MLTGYEQNKVKILKKIINNGDIVVDVGAHIGFYTMLFAKIVGEEGKVFAFEPDRNNFKILEKNKKINKYNNIIIEPKAVADKKCLKRLYPYKESRYHRLYGDNNQFFIDVECLSLDNYFIDYKEGINVVKINVVGSEGDVIKGMIDILKNNNDIKLVIQFSPKRIREYSGEPLEALSILKDLSFKVWLINNKLELVNDLKDLIKDDTTKELFCSRNFHE